MTKSKYKYTCTNRNGDINSKLAEKDQLRRQMIAETSWSWHCSLLDFWWHLVVWFSGNVLVFVNAVVLH